MSEDRRKSGEWDRRKMEGHSRLCAAFRPERRVDHAMREDWTKFQANVYVEALRAKTRNYEFSSYAWAVESFYAGLRAALRYRKESGTYILNSPGDEK